MTTARLAAFLLGSILSSSALAQQQPDPATLQRVIVQLQQQRNAAMDALAAADARATLLTEEIQKLKAAAKDAKPNGS